MALFMANLIYAITFTFAKDVMLETIRPLGFIFLRVSSAMILFHLIHALWIKEKVRPEDYSRLILCGLFGVAINMMFFFKGLSYTTPIHAAVTMTSAPIIVFVLAVIFHGERLLNYRFVGVLLGAIGAIVLAVYGRHLEMGNPNLLVGNLFIFINAFSYAIYLTIVKPLMHKYHFLTVMKWVFTTGFVVVFPFGFEEFLAVQWTNISTKIWTEIVFVVFGTSFLAYLFNIYALKSLRASTVGFYIYLQPVLATLVALALGSDKLDKVKVLACIFIFIGTYLVSKKPIPSLNNE